MSTFSGTSKAIVVGAGATGRTGPTSSTFVGTNCPITDSFDNRYMTGGWGTSTSGRTWTIYTAGATYSVGGTGIVITTGAVNSDIYLNPLGLGTVLDGTVLLTLPQTAETSGSNIIYFNMGFASPNPAGSQDYISITLPASDTGGILGGFRFGTGVGGGSASTYGFGGPGSYQLHFRFDGTGVFGSIWPIGQAEPANWQFSSTNTIPFVTEAEFDLQFAFAAAYQLTFASLDIAGIGAITDAFGRTIGANGGWGISSSTLVWTGGETGIAANVGLSVDGTSGVFTDTYNGIGTAEALNALLNSLTGSWPRAWEVYVSTSFDLVDGHTPILAFTDGGGVGLQPCSVSANSLISIHNGSSYVSSAFVTFVQGTVYDVHVKSDGVSGGTVRANVWAHGTAEPSGWMLTTTLVVNSANSFSISYSGAAGRYPVVANVHVYSLDIVGVNICSLPTSSPVTPFDLFDRAVAGAFGTSAASGYTWITNGATTLASFGVTSGVGGYGDLTGSAADELNVYVNSISSGYSTGAFVLQTTFTYAANLSGSEALNLLITAGTSIGVTPNQSVQITASLDAVNWSGVGLNGTNAAGGFGGDFASLPAFPAGGTTINLKWELQPGVLTRAKVWWTGSEPASWDLTAAYTPHTQTAAYLAYDVSMGNLTYTGRVTMGPLYITAE